MVEQGIYSWVPRRRFHIPEGSLKHESRNYTHDALVNESTLSTLPCPPGAELVDIVWNTPQDHESIASVS